MAIKEGYSLNCRIERRAVGRQAPDDDQDRAGEQNRAAYAAPLANVVYKVSDPEKDPEQHFLACLDDELHPDIGKALGLKQGDLFVCRDRALDDTLAANLALQCRLKTI